HSWYAGGWSNWESLGGPIGAGTDLLGPGLDGTAGLTAFVRGSDDALWYRSYVQGGWSGWQSLGGVLSADPQAIFSPGSRIDVFIKGSDGQAWQVSFDGSAWGGWQSLGGPIASGPGALSRATGQVDLYVDGTDRRLWQRSFNGASWGNWQPVGGVITSAPSVVSLASGRADVFVRGTDSALWHIWSWYRWSNWEPLSGQIRTGADATTFWVPVYRQAMALDCETAALQMALASLGHYYSQSDLFAYENPDTRPPVMGANHSILQWGDPYTNFVGDVNGSDSIPTGYGIYYPLILSIAQSHGSPGASAGEGYSAG